MKAFVTDYDGTLFTSDKEMKLTIKKLKKLKEKDFIIIIATGRSYPSIKSQVNTYNIPYDYLVCADGSIIYNKNDLMEKKYPMKSDIIKPFELFYQKLNYEEIQFVYPEGYSNILNNNKDLLGINICLSTDNYNNEIVDRFITMSKKYSDYSFLNYSHPNFSYLCVKPKNISKSFAIKYVIKKNKILKDDTFVIGDSPNDYEMIMDFNGVCVNKSYPIILAIAKNKYKSVNNYLDEIIKEN